jgi:hypothetical protein
VTEPSRQLLSVVFVICYFSCFPFFLLSFFQPILVNPEPLRSVNIIWIEADGPTDSRWQFSIGDQAIDISVLTASFSARVFTV